MHSGIMIIQHIILSRQRSTMY